mgnify:CR=1 FL=1
MKKKEKKDVQAVEEIAKTFIKLEPNQKEFILGFIAGINSINSNQAKTG